MPRAINDKSPSAALSTAMRDNANLPREAILRSLSEAKDNRWLTIL